MVIGFLRTQWRRWDQGVLCLADAPGWLSLYSLTPLVQRIAAQVGIYTRFELKRVFKFTTATTIKLLVSDSIVAVRIGSRFCLEDMDLTLSKCLGTLLIPSLGSFALTFWRSYCQRFSHSTQYTANLCHSKQILITRISHYWHARWNRWVAQEFDHQMIDESFPTTPLVIRIDFCSCLWDDKMHFCLHTVCWLTVSTAMLLMNASPWTGTIHSGCNILFRTAHSIFDYCYCPPWDIHSRDSRVGVPCTFTGRIIVSCPLQLQR